MGVYNGAEHLEETLDSILSQEGCDLEFVVVDDGSTDDTGRILDEWALRDTRLRVIHQENTGLTRALIRGCAEAQGEFIARQDAGDVSLPGRFKAQLELLRARPGAVAVSCHTELSGPAGEFLYLVDIDATTLNQALKKTDIALRGPSHHGSVMFRREAFEASGGYREAFYFAQDLDLWTRLIERGCFAVVEDVLYRARLEPSAISGLQTAEQNRLANLIADASMARKMGKEETPFLEKAAHIRPIAKNDRHKRMARGSYFIGSCLRRRDPKTASGYFLQAARYDPKHWRAWFRLVESRVRCLF
jgi:glycosyltransferase involved in cell wall biosynthesis